MSIVSNLTAELTVPCAECQSSWSVAYLQQLHGGERLRAQDFAFICMPTGQLFINHCPHCDLPAPRALEPQWPILLLSH